MREATKEFRELLAKWHKPELATLKGMVYQVWEDGEVTLQKSGPLLWQRNLHCIQMGDTERMIDPEAFPLHLCSPGTKYRHGYIFTDKEGAEVVRAAILAK